MGTDKNIKLHIVTDIKLHRMSEAQYSKFDDLFLGILQTCGKIEPFLDVIFNFLSRRTDFFYLMHKKDDKLGFPPGIAEKMLIKIFQKYQERILKKDPIYMKWKESGGKDSNDMWKKTDDTCKVEDVQRVEEVVSNDGEKKIPTEGDNTSTGKVTSSSEKTCDPDRSIDKKQCESTQGNIDNDCFNGGKTDKYCWSQTISDVDLKVPIPQFVSKSKDLSIDIQSHNINVSLKRDPPPDSGLESKLILSGTLKEKIKCDESLWSFVPSQHVEINLEKFEQKWWDGVFDGDEKIDRSSIDTTQHVHDFDDQTQSDIRKVMYDQQQKNLGKPTSEEQKTQAMLEKAWDAEGSPFKGTPFDPSVLNIASGGSGGS